MQVNDYCRSFSPGSGFNSSVFCVSIYFVMGNPISSCFLVFLTDNWGVFGGLTVIAGLYIVQYGWVGVFGANLLYSTDTCRCIVPPCLLCNYFAIFPKIAQFLEILHNKGKIKKSGIASLFSEYLKCLGQKLDLKKSYFNVSV